eukprot:338460_1
MADMRRSMDKLFTNMERTFPSIETPSLGFEDLAKQPSPLVPSFPLLRGGESWGVKEMPLDVVEKKDSFQVCAEVPGYDKKDIKVVVDKNVLSIKAEKREEKLEEGDNWMRKERWQGSNYRSFSLPSSVEQKKITAEHKDGVLCLNIPKSKKAEKEAGQ